MSKKSFTVNLNEELIAKLKKLAKANELKTSELVCWALSNFVNNFDMLKQKKKIEQIPESDDEEYVKYYKALRKLLSSGDIPKEAKKFLVG